MAARHQRWRAIDPETFGKDLINRSRTHDCLPMRSPSPEEQVQRRILQIGHAFTIPLRSPSVCLPGFGQRFVLQLG